MKIEPFEKYKLWEIKVDWNSKCWLMLKDKKETLYGYHAKVVETSEEIFLWIHKQEG